MGTVVIQTSKHWELIIIIIVGLLVAFAIITAMLYNWHKTIIRRYRIMRNVRFINSGNDYEERRQPTMTFEESVRVIPRPPSILYITESIRNSWRRSFGSQLSNEVPDLVAGIKDSKTEGSNSEEETE